MVPILYRVRRRADTDRCGRVGWCRKVPGVSTVTDQPKRPVGRPPKPEPARIPDTFENVVKALVRPVPPLPDPDPSGEDRI